MKGGTVADGRRRAVQREFGDTLEAQRRARISALGGQLCGHYADDQGLCGAPTRHRYLPGWRCSLHTPAKFAGRTAPVPDPARTLDGLQRAHAAATQAAA